MPYFAAAFAHVPGTGWAGRAADLDEVDGIDDVAELMREFANGDEPVLLLAEEDDEWFAVARVDGLDDLRVFLSDLRAPLTSGLAALMYQGIEHGLAEDEYDETPSRAVAGEPGGDTDLLDDLGVSSHELVELCVEEGLLPDDALSTISERLGFVEELEKLR